MKLKVDFHESNGLIITAFCNDEIILKFDEQQFIDFIEEEELNIIYDEYCNPFTSVYGQRKHILEFQEYLTNKNLETYLNRKQ
tara:strand:+ start:14542 stop:14790 length:249 start_codon:yes stop_codon:yes gene_type:complete